MILKKTPLTQKHKDAHAKMVDFAGYEMPLHYGDVLNEHLAVRKNVGIFDVSHMGEFIVKGSGALSFLNFMLSNDLSILPVGGAQYNCLINEQGGVVDDLIVYRTKEKEFMLVVNAANIDKDFQWLQSYNNGSCEITNISEDIALFALQGPHASTLLHALTPCSLSDINFYSFVKGSLGKHENILISNTGYTGAGGFELYVPKDQAVDVWDLLCNNNPEPVLCGLAARNTLRLEMGYCLYGNELKDDTSPYKAGLGWITKPHKKETMMAKDLLMQSKANIDEKLVGMVIDDKRFAREETPILSEDETTVIGKVTSGGYSPILEQPICLGYVSKAYLEQSSNVVFDLKRKNIRGRIVKTPFI